MHRSNRVTVALFVKTFIFYCVHNLRIERNLITRKAHMNREKVLKLCSTPPPPPPSPRKVSRRYSAINQIPHS